VTLSQPAALLSARPAGTSLAFTRWRQLYTHLILSHYSFIDPERTKGWVGLVGWPVADGLPTIVVTHQLQVKRGTGKVHQPQTDVLYHCATQPAMRIGYIHGYFVASFPHFSETGSVKIWKTRYKISVDIGIFFIVQDGTSKTYFNLRGKLVLTYDVIFLARTFRPSNTGTKLSIDRSTQKLTLCIAQLHVNVTGFHYSAYTCIGFVHGKIIACQALIVKYSLWIRRRRWRKRGSCDNTFKQGRTITDFNRRWAISQCKNVRKILVGGLLFHNEKGYAKSKSECKLPINSQWLSN